MSDPEGGAGTQWAPWTQPQTQLWGQSRLCPAGGRWQWGPGRRLPTSGRPRYKTEKPRGGGEALPHTHSLQHQRFTRRFTAKRWKRPTCPPTDEQTHQCAPNTQPNVIHPQEGKGFRHTLPRNHEDIVPGKIIQTRDGKSCMIAQTRGPERQIQSDGE